MHTDAWDKKFHHEFLYITFFSLSGVTIDVEASFNTAENALGIKKAQLIEDEESKDLIDSLISKHIEPDFSKVQDNIKNVWKLTSK